MSPPRAVVVGIEGSELDRDEAALLRAHQPLGVILFKRNVANRGQLRRFTAAVREALGRADAPVLVDQEGGRVQRLGPPEWAALPAAARIGEVAARDLDRAIEAAGLLAERIAADLVPLGIDWVCAPLLDLRLETTHAAIGDRAYAADPDVVAALAGAAIQGFLRAGVVPIIKHAPGHGRAQVDPHLSLPRVTATQDVLEAADFVPFKALGDAPAVMMSHVLYDALDPDAPASCSARVTALVRDMLGCRGLLFSDDVDMGALSGDVGGRVRAVLAAGSDVALQCNGVRADLEAALDAAPPLSEAALARFAGAVEQGGRRGHGGADIATLDRALVNILG